MTEIPLSIDLMDDDGDLPRTLRQKSEGVARADAHDLAQPTTLVAVDISLAQLVIFFLKCAVAIVPALLAVGLLLLVISEVLVQAMPWLTLVKIQIFVPQ